MTNKDRKRAAKQKKWEAGRTEFAELRSRAAGIKALARSRGFAPPFFDVLDSYVTEFRRTAEAAKAVFPSLVGVVEADVGEPDQERFAAAGVGPSWEQVVFECDDPAAGTYLDPGPTGNIRGDVSVFREAGGRIRTLATVRRATGRTVTNREEKYLFKLVALYHELGHVDDIEKQINFDTGAGTVDILAAEVHANVYALNECNRRGLYTPADTLEDALRRYVGGADYRAEVAKRVLTRYHRPDRVRWGDVIGGELTEAEVRLVQRA